MPRRSRSDPHLGPPAGDRHDSRAALDLSASENAELCAGCVRCCSYITVEVDAPRAAWEYDQWIWALDHRGVSLYVERPEKWFVHFETVCEHLTPQGRCAIHGKHPVLCREYDPRSCERRLPLSDIVASFRDGREFEEWIRRRRPVHHRRLVAFRAQQPPGPPVADVEADRRAPLVTIEEPRLSASAATGISQARLARGATRHRSSRRT